MRRADNAERGSEIDRGQSASIAVVEDGGAVADQSRPQRANATVDADIVIGDLLRRRQQNFAQVANAVEFAAVGDCLQSIHRPSQTDRGRACRLQQVAGMAQSRD